MDIFHAYIKSASRLHHEDTQWVKSHQKYCVWRQLPLHSLYRTCIYSEFLYFNCTLLIVDRIILWLEVTEGKRDIFHKKMSFRIDTECTWWKVLNVYRDQMYLPSQRTYFKLNYIIVYILMERDLNTSKWFQCTYLRKVLNQTLVIMNVNCEILIFITKNMSLYSCCWLLSTFLSCKRTLQTTEIA